MQKVNGGGRHLSADRYASADSFILDVRAKRALLLALLIVFANVLLFSSSLNWSWHSDDENISYYRYQLDNTTDEGWTVVDSSVTEIKLPAHEGLNTLYLEASYDGVNWSEMKSGTYEYEVNPYRTRQYEISIKDVPYSLQRIAYTVENDPSNRLSNYGAGEGLSFRYNLDSVFSLGGEVEADYHNFEGFHTYWDFKFISNVRFKLLGKDTSRNRLYLTFGGGVDYVLRNDGETESYPLIMYGLSYGYVLNEKLSLGLGVDINHTFQNGSNVLHILPFLRLSYSWGSEAGCFGC